MSFLTGTILSWRVQIRISDTRRVYTVVIPSGEGAPPTLSRAAEAYEVITAPALAGRHLRGTRGEAVAVTR